MIISPKDFELSLEEVEELFNKLVQEELDEYNKDKKLFLEDPRNECMPRVSARVWLKVGRDALSDEVEAAFRNDINLAGWEIYEWQWHKDERTHRDEIIIGIKKYNKTEE